MKQLVAFRNPGEGVALLNAGIAGIPADLRRLIEAHVLTIEQVGVLHSELGVTAAADLAAEVRRGSIGRLDGFDASLEAVVAASLQDLRSGKPRIPLGRAMAFAQPLLVRLAAVPGVEWAQPVGSLRRGEDTVGDVELLAPSSNPDAVFDDLVRCDDVERVLHRGPRRLYVIASRVQVGIRCPEPDAAGAALLHLTGSPAHLEALHRLAAAQSWHFDPEGLVTNDGSRRVAASEEEIYEALGLQMIPPEIRYGDEEIAAARENVLPTLLSRRSIRGDLHMHTQWSDGRNSTEAMVQAAVAVGHEYIAITDHSPQSSATHSLSADAIERQADEIADLRERFPEITILHGCEVDILPSGALDFPDTVLERLDIVLASLHDRAGHSASRLLERYVGAMRHPLVTLITHPGNRLVPHRAGYDLDYDRLFAAAVETGTAVEIDGAPVHLDLDGATARHAVEAGATLVVDSDCHRAELLDFQMNLGVTIARRGWIQPRHVLNTRPIDEVRAFIAAKRRRA